MKFTDILLRRSAFQNNNQGAPCTREAPFHIPSLDGIRAFSFLIVFTAHAGLGKYIPAHLGLSLFFFLSGYLITTLLRIEFDRLGNISLKEFYLRRALRILPPYYLILVFATLFSLVGIVGGDPRGDAVLLQFVHLANYQVIRDGWDGWQGATAAGTQVYWSLAVEEHFYLIFPLFYILLRWRRLTGLQQATILFAICMLVLAWRYALVYYLDAPKDRVYLGTDTRIDSILLGCILAVYGNPVLDKRLPNSRMLAFIWLPIGATAIFLSLLPRSLEFQQTLRYTLQSLGLIPFFIAAIRWHDRGIFRILNLKYIQRLGVLSYSLYLLHVIVLWGLARWIQLPSWVLGVIGFLILICLSELIYHYIERPCARLRRRLSSYLKLPTADEKNHSKKGNA